MKNLLKAIKIGVVDYLIKPSSKQAIREAIFKVFDEGEIVKIAKGFSFDLVSKTLYKNNKIVKLSLCQKLSIELLVRNKNKIVTIEELFFHINHSDKNCNCINSIRNLIKRVR